MYPHSLLSAGTLLSDGANGHYRNANDVSTVEGLSARGHDRFDNVSNLSPKSFTKRQSSRCSERTRNTCLLDLLKNHTSCVTYVFVLPYAQLHFDEIEVLEKNTE